MLLYLPMKTSQKTFNLSISKTSLQKRRIEQLGIVVLQPRLFAVRIRRDVDIFFVVEQQRVLRVLLRDTFGRPHLHDADVATKHHEVGQPEAYKEGEVTIPQYKHTHDEVSDSDAQPTI